jgi:hypothetical protein
MLLRRTAHLALGVLFLLLAGTSRAALVIDFETDTHGAPLSNGTAIATPPHFGPVFSVHSTGGAGAALFDSTPGGPNAGGADPDLLVGLGNVLIIQNGSLSSQSVPGVFDVPNDSAIGGTITFQFVEPVELLSLTVVDADRGFRGTVTLIDVLGLERVYSIEPNFSRDIDRSGPLGYQVLDLTKSIDQIGEGGGKANAREDLGFEARAVGLLRWQIQGSGALDNLVLRDLTAAPEPTSAALLAAGLLGIALARRR